MIKYIERGNIFKLNGVKNYAHGCNCKGSMGAGIAVQFKERWPKMYRQYNSMCWRGDYNPGDVFDFEYAEKGKTYHIYNLATQKTYGRSGPYARLEWIEQSVTEMIRLAEESSVSDIAMPKIGAGLGGLNWNDVKAVLEKVAGDNTAVTIHVVENFKE